MDLIQILLDYLIHLDKHLGVVIQFFGPWVYVIFFLIIFCETGLVITPFLPGDSMLFTIGAFAAQGALHGNLAFILLALAAIAGDTVNYWIGWYLGPKVFHYEDSRWFKKKYLERTHQFFERHGGKTIIFARFIPIIRTFAPFVAGIGVMTYWRFLLYNICGGISWVALFLYGGYFFGNLPLVKRNFTLVIMVIIFLSVLPAVSEFLRQKMQEKRLSH